MNLWTEQHTKEINEVFATFSNARRDYLDMQAMQLFLNGHILGLWRDDMARTLPEITAEQTAKLRQLTMILEATGKQIKQAING